MIWALRSTIDDEITDPTIPSAAVCLGTKSMHTRGSPI